MEKKEEKTKNHIVNVLKEEWKYLGKYKKTYIFYLILFSIAGLIGLLTPLVIGLIFNAIQQTISSPEELTKLLWLISLLLVINVGFWAFHGPARILEQRVGFNLQRQILNNFIFIISKIYIAKFNFSLIYI